MTLIKTAYTTPKGVFFLGKIENIIRSPFFIKKYKGKFDLIFTSPPFPLNRKKKYGNLQGQEYLEWFASLAEKFIECIKPEGSIVIEVGNSWVKGEPTMSTLALESLLTFLNNGKLFLCQQFIWNNPAKLPSPAQWVNVERIRVKDAFTHIWWMSPTARPKANNRNVLTEYSTSMKKLLKVQKYNSGKRPSEHNIGEKSFLKNNKGAIPSNVITVANTKASSDYLIYCKKKGFTPHPARMPEELAEFFIKLLTEPGDLVLDPFAGSNTTGAVAEKLERRWVSAEVNEDYIDGSKGRFLCFNEENHA
ncbi:MAG: DNA-methyltransferase [Candidatus Hodarchaeales archaeon]|mgnify:CR=1 FL=1